MGIETQELVVEYFCSRCGKKLKENEVFWMHPSSRDYYQELAKERNPSLKRPICPQCLEKYDRGYY